MNPNETALAHQLRRFAVEGSNDIDAARKIIALAIHAPDGLSTLTAARVAEVIEQFPTALAGFEERIAEFEATLGRRVEIIGLLDRLADPGTPTRNLLDIAAPGHGQLEISDADFDALHQVRIRAEHRIDGARRLLEAFGWERIDPEIGPSLRTAGDELMARAEQFQAQGLFVDQQNNRGYVLGVQVHRDETGEVRPRVEVGRIMENQAALALAKANGEGAGAEWSIEWPFDFDGASIGLALYVGALVERHELDPDPLLAVTGEIDIHEHVIPIMGIEAKLEAAARAGFRRVLLPEGNREEASATSAARRLDLIYVSRTGEIATALAQIAATEEESFADRVGRWRKRIKLAPGLVIRDERKLPNAHRFEVADTGGSVFIDVFTGSKGTVKVVGKDSSAKQKAQQLIDANAGTAEQRAHPPLSFNVPDETSERRVRNALVDAGAAEQPLAQAQSINFRLTRGAAAATVVVYASGRAVLQAGKDPAYTELRAILDQALAGVGGLQADSDDAAAGSDAMSASISFDEPHIGTDESGKGDYFGPLVSAAVFTDRETAAALTELGVRDSKKLTDKSVRKLAAEVRRVARGRYAVTRIGPERFNTLFTQMKSEGKNMNTLLAWGHARSIEDLLANGVKAKFVVVDQFADARYMEQKILADTRESGMEFMLFPKAEADIAVAAASILARDNFLDWLEHESKRLGITLPKGASDQVVAAGREIVARHGPERLQSVAKMSFKTTQKVLAQ